MSNDYRLYPLGDSGIVVSFGDEINFGIHKRIQQFTEVLEQSLCKGMIEYVPAFATVTIYYDPWIMSEKGRRNPYTAISTYIEELLFRQEEKSEAVARQIEIPVCYGGKYGPDLERVAAFHSLTPDEVISIHTNGEYLVYMIGFAPGFPYLGGMSEEIATPRKESPRNSIPKGSVGIAGMQTGVYPIETPGGWQLIGRTPLTLFNPEKDSPSLLQAGDRIRFVSISETEYEAQKEVDEDEY